MAMQFALSMNTLSFYDTKPLVTAIAITPFEMGEATDYKELLERTLFIKLDQNQKECHSDLDIVSFWQNKVGDYVKDAIYTPHKDDVSIPLANEMIIEFLNKWNYNKVNSYIWARNYAMYWSAFHSNFSSTKMYMFTWNDTKTIDLISSGMESMNVKINVDGYIHRHTKHESAMEAFKILHSL